MLGRKQVAAAQQLCAARKVLITGSVLLVVVFFGLTFRRDESLEIKIDTAVKSKLAASLLAQQQSNSSVQVLQQELFWSSLADGGATSTAEPSTPTATLILELHRAADGDAVTTGPQHQAHFFVTTSEDVCPFPRFGVRLVGPALVPVLLEQQPREQVYRWSGSFHIPVAGSYRVETQWYGCREQSGDTMGEDYTASSSPLEFIAVGPLSLPATNRRPTESHLFTNSVWLPTEDMTFIDPKTEEPVVLPDYMWLDPTLENPLKDDFLFLEQESHNISTTVSQRGTFTKEHGMYKFSEVGNYELVCFWGSETMAAIRNRFMKLRGILAPSNRPFKFHYYNVTSLTHPDAEWPESGKTRCRKCKHIFVSVDELDERLSQATFLEQYTAFVHNLVKLLEDDTFPIWLLTNNESPAMASNCHSPAVLPRSTDHPCNTVIQNLFRPGAKAFPSQVHLLDNTDLVLPHHPSQSHHYRQENRDHILANIALRIFVAVGKGVTDWRAAGQQGKWDGDKILVPYNWDG